MDTVLTLVKQTVTMFLLAGVGFALSRQASAISSETGNLNI